MANKRRIADDVRQSLYWNNCIPVYTKRIAFCYVGVGLQWQEIVIEGYNLFCLSQHLGLTDPKGSGGYRHGKIVNLYAVELRYADLDGRIAFQCQECLTVISGANDIIL